jgi:hypothetical protein
MRGIQLLPVGLLVAVGTWLFGWWAVPLVGFVHALVWRGRPGVMLEAGLGGMLGWGWLMALQGMHPAFPRLAELLEGIFPVPSAVLMGASLLFAGLLAGAAAGVVPSSPRPPVGAGATGGRPPSPAR